MLRYVYEPLGKVHIVVLWRVVRLFDRIGGGDSDAFNVVACMRCIILPQFKRSNTRIPYICLLLFGFALPMTKSVFTVSMLIYVTSHRLHLFPYIDASGSFDIGLHRWKLPRSTSTRGHSASNFALDFRFCFFFNLHKFSWLSSN